MCTTDYKKWHVAYFHCSMGYNFYRKGHCGLELLESPHLQEEAVIVGNVGLKNSFMLTCEQEQNFHRDRPSDTVFSEIFMPAFGIMEQEVVLLRTSIHLCPAGSY